MRSPSRMNIDLGKLRKMADARLRSTMDPDDVALADRMEEIRARNCSTPRDALVRRHLRAMNRSLISPHGEKKAKILFISGEANSGKTRLIENAIAGDRSFDSYVDAYGKATQTLSSRAPSPCTQRNLAIRLVKNLGFSVLADIRMTRAWPLLEEQIRFWRARWIFLDEAQRAMKLDNPKELQELSDNIISLVDADDWPVRIVMMGVDPLPELRNRDTQMSDRSEIIQLTPVSLDRTRRVETWLVEIVVDHAGLELHAGEFTSKTIVLVAQKLVHGCAGNAGSIIELIRSAVEVALMARRTIVILADFAQAYHNHTHCLPHDNIFEVSIWKAVPAGIAKIKKAMGEEDDEDDVDPEDDDPDFEKPKPGDRPR